MTDHAFGCMTSGRIADLVRRAQRRALLCAPAVRRKTAEAFQEAASRLGSAAVRVVLDCDEEVFRLGYGDVEAVQLLKDSDVDVRQCPGLRVGLLVVDDRAWAFTPTALYVQPEVHSDETPNAVELPVEAADRLALSICPEVTDVTAGLPPDQRPEPEIGQTPLGNVMLKNVAEGLKVAPPISFDVARQVRVFQPYIQYVEISLRGCAIQKHRVTIPRTMQGLGATKDIENRLRTTFDLIEKNSDLSSKPLEDELEQLRKDFTRPLGKPWGRVLLRSVRPVFDERICEFRKKLDEHRKKVESELEAKLKASRQQVVEYYLPAVKAHPPDCLLGQLLAPKPTDDQMRTWLDGELERVFPRPDQLLSTMVLDVQFRDVTYETLNEEGFAEALQKAYPHVNWDKPFDEFHAAKERPDGQPNRGGNA
jgi:hypothetical protein